MKDGTRLYVNITNHCNSNCPFCCMYSGTEKNTFMEFTIFKSIIDNCGDIFELQLEGGEPLLHKDLFLFMEYAISTTKCSKIIILSNGSTLNDNILKRIISIANWYNIMIEIKISINYYLIGKDDSIFMKYNKLLFATNYIPNINILFNVRLRKEDNYETMANKLDKYDLLDNANIYYFQSYGKLSNSKYDKPVINQNIKTWKIYSCDGKCFDTDLIARSEHEKDLK